MKPTSPRLVLILSYLTYLLFGAFTAAVGPVLGELADQTSSTLATIGGVVTLLFVGAIVAQVLAGPLTDRFGHKAVLVASLIVLAAGMLAFTNARALPWMLGLALFAGLGQGGVDMGANLVVADAAPGKSTSALNLLHFFFGLGAFIGPALVGLAIVLTGSGLIVHWVIAGLFALLAIAISAFLRVSARPDDAGPRIEEPPSDGLKIYLSPLLWLMAILLLVYVGVEISLGSWISAYMGISTGALPQVGAWITSAYWAALALGRLAGAAASARLTRMQLLSVALGGSLLGGLGLFIGRGAVLPTVVSLAWIAFSYATVYPTTVALGNAVFARDRGKAISVMIALGSAGAAIFPFFAGGLLEGTTYIDFLWMMVLGLALLLVILFFIYRLMRGRPDAGAGAGAPAAGG
jgi:fucose permease